MPKYYFIACLSMLKNMQSLACKVLNFTTLLCLLCLTAFAPSNAMASSQVIVSSDLLSGVRLLARPSIETGGGELVSASDSKGDSSSLKGGDGVSAEVGIRLNLRPFQRPAFDTELTFGGKTMQLKVGSGSADFTYYTIAVSQFYRFKNRIRIGAGIGINLSSDLEVDVSGFEDTNTSFDTTPEYRAMLEYTFKGGTAIGGRYRATDWTSDGITVDGSSAGFYMTLQTH